MDPLVILYSLFGPFLVWPFEYLLPNPHIIEELFKYIVVKWTNGNLKSYIYGGIVFALSETVLYSININASGNINLILVRFILTSLLHSTTFVIIYYFSKKKGFLKLTGLVFAILIHFLYNRYIPSY